MTEQTATASRGRDFTLRQSHVKGTVYLLHFDSPFGHAKHYTGWAANLGGRMIAHVNGRGAKLTSAVKAAGIGWSVAQTWEEVDRFFERKLKNRGGATRHCPICQGKVAPGQVAHYGPSPAYALLAA